MDTSEEFCFEVPIVDGENLNRLDRAHRKNSNASNLVKSIVIDVDNENDNDCTILDIDNTNAQKNGHKTFKDVFNFDALYKDNKLFTDVIEKCLDMENSAGMLRIINKTLIPIYKDANEVYKKSSTFQSVLKRTIMKIETDPDQKFSHIKNLCECLKLNIIKKKAPFKTLKTTLNGKFSTYYLSLDETPKKRKKIDVINLDDDDDVVLADCNKGPEIQIQITDIRGHFTEDNLSSVDKANFNLDEVEIVNTDILSEVEVIEENNLTNNKEQDNDVILLDDDSNSNKENKTIDKESTKSPSSEVLIDSLANKTVENLSKELPLIDLSKEPDEVDSNKVLNPGEPAPITSKVTSEHEKVKQRIKNIELVIAEYNKEILKLDEKEVDADDLKSPYIQSEMYKAKVVCLYKELCKLTGAESVKKRKVRLKVANNHPEGPVKCLEEFINNNIDANGNPPFPDMFDVINCVKQANTMYNIGWNKKQIEEEAQILFIHYGRTAQKKRMKREWRHLMSYVKEEAPDPADQDPALQAHLQQNSRIAKKNEDDLLDRFAKMENTPNNDARLHMDSDDSEQESDSRNVSIPDVPNRPSEPFSDNLANNSNLNLNPYKQSCSGNITNNVILYPWTIPVTYPAHMTYVVVNNMVPSGLVAPTVIIPGLTQIEVNNLEASKNAPGTGHNRNIVTIDKDGMSTGLATSINTNNIQRETQNDMVPNNSETCGTSTSSDIGQRINTTQNHDLNNDSNKASEAEKTNPEPAEIVINKSIKREPLDIPRMLEQLGNNFTATIIDIEDPFSVIEISDSSDSENEEI